MGAVPFLEIKIDTDIVRFSLQIFRIAAEFAKHSPLQVDEIRARAVGIELVQDGERRHTFDIQAFPREILREIAEREDVTWELRLRSNNLGCPLLDGCTLRAQIIGGSHPLLVQFMGGTLDKLDWLLMERCGELWEAQIVTVQSSLRDVCHMLRNIDARNRPWLDRLERAYWGNAYERFSSTAAIVRATTVAGQALAGVSPPPQRPEPPHEPPAPPPQPAPPPSSTARDSDGGESCEEPNGGPRRYGPTEDKLAELSRMLDEKRSGRYRHMGWTTACQTVGIDPKTAARHAHDLKAAWQELSQQSSR